jgi:hypothetical protein
LIKKISTKKSAKLPFPMPDKLKEWLYPAVLDLFSQVELFS